VQGCAASLRDGGGEHPRISDARAALVPARRADLTALRDAGAKRRGEREVPLAPETSWLPWSSEHEGVAHCGRIYSLDRIAPSPAQVNDPDMPNSPISHTTKRPADNELYDRGCDLVEAAMEIRHLADDPAAARAVPALLGCLEAAMHELGCAVVSLDETSGYAVRIDTVADRMHRGFMNLGLALADVEFASTAARGLAARSIAPASGSRAAGSHRLRSLDAGSGR
jgi:hypothetical protein